MSSTACCKKVNPSGCISKAVTSGQNNLQIEVANSLQNLLLQEPKSSGLVGQVRIVPYKEIRFELQ